jgi:hypothetical protein
VSVYLRLYSVDGNVELNGVWNPLCSDPDYFVACGWLEWEELGAPIRVAGVLTEFLTGHFRDASAHLIQSLTGFL